MTISRSVPTRFRHFAQCCANTKAAGTRRQWACATFRSRVVQTSLCTSSRCGSPIVLERLCLVLQAARCSVRRLLDDYLCRKVHAGCIARVPHIIPCSFHRRLTHISTERKEHPCLRNLAAWHPVMGIEKNHVHTFVDLGMHGKLRRPLPDSQVLLVVGCLLSPPARRLSGAGGPRLLAKGHGADEAFSSHETQCLAPGRAKSQVTRVRTVLVDVPAALW